MMEYTEVPNIPKGMMEKLYASKAFARMSDGACTATGVAARNGYRTLPPLAKGFLCQADDSRLPLVTGLGLKAGPVPDLQNRETMIPVGTIEPGSCPQQSLMNGVTCAGGMAPGKPVKAMQLKGTIERGSKKRGATGNGASGIRSKIRKAGLAPPCAGFADTEVPTLRKKRQRKPGTVNDEQGDKPPSRRRSRTMAKKEIKICQLSDCAQNESCVKLATEDSRNLAANSILGIHSFKTQPVDLVRYMEDVTIEDLMSAGETNGTASAGKEILSESNGSESVLLEQLNSSLQLLPKPAGIEAPLHTKFVPTLANNKEYGRRKNLTSDHTTSWGRKENALPIDTKKESCSQFCNGMEAFPEGILQNDRILLKDPPVFSVDHLPLYPLSKVLGALKLQPNEQLESLLQQVREDATPETSAHPGTSSSSLSSRVIHPPLPLFSKTCQASCDADHEKYKRGNCWFRAGLSKGTSSEKGNDWFDSWKKRGLKGTTDLGNSCKRVKVQRLHEIDLNKKSTEEIEVGAIPVSYGTALQPEWLSTIAMRDEVALPTAAHHPTFKKDERERETVGTVNRDDSNWTECRPYCSAETNIDGNLSCIQGSVYISYNKFTANDLARSDSLTEPQKLVENQEKQQNNEVKPNLKTGNFNGQGISQCSKLDLSQSVSSQMQPVQLPFSHKSSCTSMAFNDSPCSPRVQVAARLLCNMANSRSLFYTPIGEHPEALGEKVPKPGNFAAE